MIDKIIKILEKKANDNASYCKGFSDSGDIGACFAHEVEPIREMITYLESLKKEQPLGYKARRDRDMKNYKDQ